jgi:hypothetical protein
VLPGTVKIFPLTQGLLDAVFFAPATRLRRGRTYLAKTGLDAAQLPFALLGNLQRREFILNRLPAVDALCFFMFHFHVLNLFFLVQRRQLLHHLHRLHAHGDDAFEQVQDVFRVVVFARPAFV